ncbi:MAG TPA: AzlD domain-containing protein [Nocardioidaceae bacterium]|nr:AzlD domain-containing protein [Nocardioidaceae bacterium]
MTAWIVISLAGLGSYLFRISMVLLAERITLPDKVERASAFMAPAAFAALAATGIAASTAGSDITQAVPLLAAVAVAVIAVRHTGRPYLAVVAGMPTLWLLTVAVGA